MDGGPDGHGSESRSNSGVDGGFNECSLIGRIGGRVGRTTEEIGSVVVIASLACSSIGCPVVVCISKMDSKID